MSHQASPRLPANPQKTMSIGVLVRILCLQTIVLGTSNAFITTIIPSSSLRWELYIGFAQNNAADAQKQQQLSVEDELFLERFKRRRNDAALKVESERLERPPSNSSYFEDPKNVIAAILNGLLRPHEPVPFFGYEILYSSCTKHWQDVLRKSVGATIGTEIELIYRALSASMEREHNQFGILVGLGTDHNDVVTASSSESKQQNGNDYDEEEYYTIEFPWDTLDYYDGTAWLECRLREKQSDELLCVLGWSLEKSDGSWLVNGIDWQDFRERYRPGVGREEWERICG